MVTFTTKGWLYCVTSPEYEKQGIYKCGYTTKGETKQEAEQKLMTRYGTSWISVLLSGIVSVSTPHQAEQEWFEKMKEYRLKKGLILCSVFHIFSHLIFENPILRVHISQVDYYANMCLNDFFFFHFVF